jgi:hypothetical protein
VRPSGTAQCRRRSFEAVGLSLDSGRQHWATSGMMAHLAQEAPCYYLRLCHPSLMNQYAIEGLKAKLAEINTATRAAQKQIRTLTADKATIVRPPVIMGSEPGGKLSLGIASGAFSRTIRETLGGADKPLGVVREIADRLAPRAGRPPDKREMGLLVARVRNAMHRLADRLDGKLRRRTTYWRMRGGSPSR